MSTLSFPDTHNMVAFLEKPAESDGFHEIINFLNANQIHYALTINPTIYTSCIEQFWATTKTPITAQPSTSKPQKKQSRRNHKKNTKVPHPSDSTTDVPNEEHVPTYSNDPLLSGEDKMKLTELMDMCTKLSERVLDLEHTKTAQAQEITNLKLRVKKLEKKACVEIVVETEEPVINAATTTNLLQSVVATLAITIPPQQRAKGIAFREPVESTIITTVPSQKSKDKGKAMMIEPKMPLKKKDQIELDEELKREIKAEEQAELERIQKERAAQEEASRAAIYEEWDNEQAMMEADYELAANLQENEREAMSIEEKSRRLAELIRERKKFFAAQRAEAIRNKPPTKTQRRNQMIQYLKNMAGYSHAQLKDKSFDECKKEECSKKKDEGSSKKKSISRKRAKDKQEQESSKRQRVEDDKEEEELKKCFELAKEEEIAINAIPLATKVSVVGFQIHTRVKAKHGDNRPKEDFERVLWGDLRVMFEPDVESEVWRSLQGYKIQKMNIKFRGGLLGLKGFLKLLLLMFISTADTKVNAAGLQLLEELLLLEG
ncbi:hypothetical protein Tco_1419250 [Tanacetum coccineum]